MRLQKDLLDDIRSIGWNIDEREFEEIYTNVKSHEGYFQPFKIKSIAKKKVTYSIHKEGGQLIAAAVFDTRKRNVEVKSHAKEITKSSVVSEFFLKSKVKGNLKCRLTLSL